MTVRTVHFRDRTWRIVDESHHTAWVIGEIEAGRWEQDTFDTIDLYVQGGVFVDVGAWIGMMSLYAAPHAKHVYALEPDPVARGMLVRNLDLNGVTNVTVMGFALWRSEGTIKLAEYDGWGSSMTGPTRTGEGIEVNTITPRMLWALIQPDPVDLVKVDTEGSEIQIMPQLVSWPCPIHLSIHGSFIDRTQVDLGGRETVRLGGDADNYTVLVK